MPRFRQDGDQHIPFTAEEETARDLEEANHWKNRLDKVRMERNMLLQQTDWWGASDQTMTAAQTKYRKDLRDLPTGLVDDTTIDNLEWPTKP